MNEEQSAFWPPVWSRQHGAYLSLMTSWLIATGISVNLSAWHVIGLIFLLSGINFGDILQEWLKKKFRKLATEKMLWMTIYGILAVASGWFLYQFTMTFRVIMPLVALAGILYLAFSVNRQHKSFFAELLVFSCFALSGLIAIDPLEKLQYEKVGELWLLMTVYFGATVLSVKARVGKVAWSELITYLIFTGLIIYWILGLHLIALAIGALVWIKVLPIGFALEWYQSLPIKAIGFAETGFCFLLAIIAIIGYR